MNKRQRELAARIAADLDLKALGATIREYGQAYIGTETGFLQDYQTNQEDLERALEQVAGDQGWGTVIGGLDGNWPGEWFFVQMVFTEGRVA